MVLTNYVCCISQIYMSFNFSVARWKCKFASQGVFIFCWEKLPSCHTSSWQVIYYFWGELLHKNRSFALIYFSQVTKGEISHTLEMIHIKMIYLHVEVLKKRDWKLLRIPLSCCNIFLTLCMPWHRVRCPKSADSEIKPPNFMV